MKARFGPWTTAIHDHGRAPLAAFWRRRFRSLPAVSSAPSSTRLSIAGACALAVLGLCLPTFLAAPVQAEREPEATADRQAAGEREPTREQIAAQRAERLKELEKNADPQDPRGRPDIERKGSLEFIEQPARQAFEYLGDAYRVRIMLPRGDFRARRVTVTVEDKPLRELLDIVCEHLGLDWDTDGYIIYVGPEAAVDRYRRVFRTRDERRRDYPRALARPLQERVDAEFIAQPLGPALGLLSAATQVPIQVAEHPRLANERISFVAPGLPLDVVLDLIAVEYGLTWEITDAGTVLVKAAPEPAADQQGEAQPAARHFVAHEVTTELQRLLLPAGTRVYVAVDGWRIIGDDPADPEVLAAMDQALAQIENKNGSVLFSLYITTRTPHALDGARRQLRENLLRQRAIAAGFRDAHVWSHVSNANVPFQDHLARGFALPGETADAEEAGATDGRVIAYPVRTPLSRLLTGGSDCVVDVRGPIRRGELDDAVRRSIDSAVSELNLRRKSQLTLRAGRFDLSSSDLAQLRDDLKEVAEALGFSGSRLVTR